MKKYMTVFFVLCILLSVLLPASAVSAEGGVIINLATDKSVQFEGSWQKSGAVANYDGTSTLWPEGEAGFTLPLVLPADSYELFYYVGVHENNTKEFQLKIEHNQKTDYSPKIDTSTGERRWESLGVYDFSGNGEEAIILEKIAASRTRRATAIRIVSATDPNKALGPEEPEREEIDFSALKPPHEDYELLFADEFDKPIDENIWSYRTGERLGGYNYPENVTVRDGRMYHEMRYDVKDGVRQFTGGGIISKEFFGYGYYETKCKLFGETGGMHSSFWSMGFGGDGVIYPKDNNVYEIDGYEIDSHRKKRVTCNLNFKIGGNSAVPGAPLEDFPTDQEFVLGYEWLPNEINWYMNGELIQSRKGGEVPIHYAQQNLWITGLANAELSGEVDESKLPGEASWDYVRFYAQKLKDVNLLGASEFEYNMNPEFAKNRDPQNPVSWMEIGDIEASFVEKNANAVGGNNVLAHRAQSDYQVTTAQRLYYIPNGEYALEAYVMSSGGQNTAKIRVSDFGGEAKEVEIPQSDKMMKVTIDGIAVSDNGAYVEIISDAKKDQWLLVDNISFYATEGREVEKAIPYTTKLTETTLGEKTVTITDKGFTKSGEWTDSGLAGFNNQRSIYSYGKLENEWAQFEIEADKDGKYDVSFYKVAYNNSGKNCHVSYTVNGKTVEKNVDLSSNGGWEVLGSEELKKGDKVTVRIDNKNAGLIRASAVGLQVQNSIALKDVILLMIGSKNVWSYGEKLPIDPNDSEVKPMIQNERTMVPIRFIAENLGAEVDYEGETQTITITYQNSTIVLKINDSTMTVNGNETTLDAAPTISHDRTFVPLRAISEGFGKTVSWLPDKYVLIGEKAYEGDDDIKSMIEELMQ